ncbi:hypothetical protein PMAYCL1PPCAC_02039 [Pristionchus mayeri]|uniref:Uncharacterized protein n=1 Tax=Pristionchus mayeri TaxID=1317129 RepID=A0AAN4Z211_9BILA|nr:hypothetical protein PMAYCL1PPCAC_02039 [Pristionchus mayeri]
MESIHTKPVLFLESISHPLTTPKGVKSLSSSSSFNSMPRTYTMGEGLGSFFGGSGRMGGESNPSWLETESFLSWESRLSTPFDRLNSRFSPTCSLLKTPEAIFLFSSSVFEAASSIFLFRSFSICSLGHPLVASSLFFRFLRFSCISLNFFSSGVSDVGNTRASLIIYSNTNMDVPPQVTDRWRGDLDESV